MAAEAGRQTPTRISTKDLEETIIAAGDTFRGFVFPLHFTTGFSVPPYTYIPIPQTTLLLDWSGLGMVEVRRSPLLIYAETYTPYIQATVYADDVRLAQCHLLKPFEPDFSIFYAKRKNIRVEVRNYGETSVNVLFELRLLFLTADMFDRFYRPVVESWLKRIGGQLGVEIAPRGEARPWRML
ncbi:MAG: hypothetical protein QXP81_10845 [Nitrososphaerota archaeon]